MRITETRQRVKISIFREELTAIANLIGYDSVQEMLRGGVDELFAFIVNETREKKGIDILKDVSAAIPINMVFFEDVLLMEIPKEGYEDDEDLADENDAKSLDELLETLIDAVFSQSVEQAGAKNRTETFLYEVPSVGKALEMARHVLRGKIIRRNDKIYISTEKEVPYLTEHCTGTDSAMVPGEDNIICAVIKGKPVSALRFKDGAQKEEL